MSSLRDLLRHDDPVPREPGLTPFDVARMRRAMLDSASAPVPRSSRAGMVLAAALTIAAASGLAVQLMLPGGTPTASARLEIPAAGGIDVPHHRQIHFTAGDTRVIWMLDERSP